MGLFGKKKVRFEQWGILMAMVCPCDPSQAGPGGSYPQQDEIVPGYTEGELTKCTNCGAIFISYGEKNQGKIVGKGRTFEEERSQGLTMRVTLDD